MQFLPLLLLVVLSSHSFAGVYKWIDDNGQIHFGDNPPEPEISEEVTVTVNTYTSVSYDASTYDTQGQLIFYTKDDCGFCKKARRYMNANGIIYDERNLDRSRAARIQHKRLKASGVPVFLKGKRRMNGYLEAKLARFVRENEPTNPQGLGD